MSYDGRLGASLHVSLRLLIMYAHEMLKGLRLASQCAWVQAWAKPVMVLRVLPCFKSVKHTLMQATHCDALLCV